MNILHMHSTLKMISTFDTVINMADVQTMIVKICQRRIVELHMFNLLTYRLYKQEYGQHNIT